MVVKRNLSLWQEEEEQEEEEEPYIKKNKKGKDSDAGEEDMEKRVSSPNKKGPTRHPNAVYHNQSLGNDQLNAYKQILGPSSIVTRSRSSRSPSSRSRSTKKQRNESMMVRTGGRKYTRGTYRKRKKLPTSSTWFGVYAQGQK